MFIQLEGFFLSKQWMLAHSLLWLNSGRTYQQVVFLIVLVILPTVALHVLFSIWLNLLYFVG